MELINIADLKEGNGKTIRENNMDKKHNIEIGKLVELDNGVRLFVFKHIRDCDGTPLYVLTWNEHIIGEHENFNHTTGGYSEDFMKEVK